MLEFGLMLPHVCNYLPCRARSLENCHAFYYITPPPRHRAKNSRSSHLHALTTCKWVKGHRTWPARVSTESVRQCGNRKMVVRCKHVVSMYNSLTTCATYDARNRSRPGVAGGPHILHLAQTVRVTWVDAFHRCFCYSLPMFSEKRGGHGLFKKRTD